MTHHRFLSLVLLLSLPLISPPGLSATEARTLKDAYHDAFLIGVAVNPAQFEETDKKGAELILREFNSISPENVLKWEHTEPRDGEFTFAAGDRYVAFGEQHHLAVIGHNLVWHNQLPAWVSQPPAGAEKLTREVLLDRLHRHIMTVAGHYRGRILGWDVVNEAIADGTGAYRDSVFYRVIGKEFLVMAFKWAQEADPHAELYYNDYNLDQDDKKRATAIELIKYLRANGARVDGIGLQGHYNLTYPSAAKIDETIGMFADLGLKVMITELDVQAIANQSISGAVGAFPTTSTRPPANAAKRWRGWGRSQPPKPLTPEQQTALAERYGEIFGVFWKHRAAITRVTFWGLRDADSWRRYASPLIFDDNYQPKPAYFAVLKAAK